MKILVLNSGSSSLKFKLFSRKGFGLVAKGLIEEVGSKESKYSIKSTKPELNITKTVHIPDHLHAFNIMFELLGNYDLLPDLSQLFGIGHRVVHGGEHFSKPVVIDEEVIDTIERLIPLAPLHNPSNLLGIRLAMEHAHNVPQVAVFDTAFHQTMAPHAFLYGLPEKFYSVHKVRRYGFHGTSCNYVTKMAARFLQIPLNNFSCLCLHLGNGASATAVKKGVSVDTSMGLTPLEGLVMGTRSGNIDPGIIFFMNRNLGLSDETIEHILNKKSGLLGLCDTSDMREIEKRASMDDRRAILALDIFCFRIKKYIGAYLAAWGRPDCIIFTGGIGENSPVVRKKVCKDLDHLGILLDDAVNDSTFKPSPDKPVDISRANSLVRIVVVPTNEELEIAQQTVRLLEQTCQ